MTGVPLSVLDLVPVSSGADAATALRNTIDLARQTERFGYGRYWFAEHHLNPGVLGASPPVVIALVAGATERIRLGSAGVQTGHRTPLATVEEFGLLDALHPGRLDLGLGRSGKQVFADRRAGGPKPPGRKPDNGLLIPPPFDFSKLAKSPLIPLTFALLQQPGAESPDYGEQVDDILAFLAGTYRSPEGIEVHATPGEGADVQVWILGSSGGQSATVAGKHALRFAANYHISPSGVLEAVDAYRAAFEPAEHLREPYVAVSVDVVVAEDDDTARALAAGYGPWVRGIRQGEGAIPFPSPEEVAAFEWTEEDRALVADRVDTQFVGAPSTVATRLRQLQEATGADELAVTTITHDHKARVRSYELLAAEWGLS